MTPRSRLIGTIGVTVTLAMIVVGAVLLETALHYRGTSAWSHHRPSFAAGVVVLIAALGLAGTLIRAAKGRRLV
jgi:hypothetical protein